jgi:hypothetical protein
MKQFVLECGDELELNMNDVIKHLSSVKENIEWMQNHGKAIGEWLKRQKI